MCFFDFLQLRANRFRRNNSSPSPVFSLFKETSDNLALQKGLIPLNGDRRGLINCTGITSAFSTECLERTHVCNYAKLQFYASLAVASFDIIKLIWLDATAYFDIGSSQNSLLWRFWNLDEMSSLHMKLKFYYFFCFQSSRTDAISVCHIIRCKQLLQREKC